MSHIVCISESQLVGSIYSMPVGVGAVAVWDCAASTPMQYIYGRTNVCSKAMAFSRSFNGADASSVVSSSDFSCL